MGFAILWIYLYHQGQIGLLGYDQFIPNGWAGVEIFFLLSAMGLCYSLQKNSDVLSFYKRRVVRIIPTWWVIIALGTVILCLMNAEYPDTWWKWMGWFSGLGWWLHGLMPDPKGNSFEWYIPTLLAFYAATPWLYKMNKRILWTLLIISVALGLIAAYMGWGKSVYMSWQRIPVYLLGLIVFKHSGGVKCWKLSFCAFVGFMVFAIGFMLKDDNVIFSLTLRRYGMVGILPVLLYGVAFVTSRVKWIKSALVFMGTISMEIYLIHINPDVFRFMFSGLRGMMPFPLFVFVSFAIVVAIAFVIHTAMKPLLKRLG